MSIDRTREQVAAIIEAFITGSCGPYDWDDFTSISINNPELDAIRARCNTLSTEFPPQNKDEYCGPEGVEVMQQYADMLRQ